MLYSQRIASPVLGKRGRNVEQESEKQVAKTQYFHRQRLWGSFGLQLRRPRLVSLSYSHISRSQAALPCPTPHSSWMSVLTLPTLTLREILGVSFLFHLVLSQGSSLGQVLIFLSVSPFPLSQGGLVLVLFNTHWLQTRQTLNKKIIKKKNSGYGT